MISFEHAVTPVDCEVRNKKHFSALLTDEEDIPDALTKLRVIYKNIMKLEYDNARTRHSAQITGASDIKSKSPLEHFEEFYELQNGQAISDEQRAFLTEIIESIWGEN